VVVVKMGTWSGFCTMSGEGPAISTDTAPWAVPDGGAKFWKPEVER
jgi:hypothetical protein